MLRRLAVLLGVLALSGVAAQTQAPCPGAPAPQVFAVTATSIENLAFSGHGYLYLSTANPGRLLQVAPDGSMLELFVGAGHGLLFGPDGKLYLPVADGADTFSIHRTRTTGPWASGPDFAGDLETYATGLPAYNGMAFDAAGNLYVSDDNIAPPETPPDLVRVPAANPSKWEPWSPVYGPDGIVYDAAKDVLYTVVPADQSSPVLRLSTTDASKVEVVTHLSFGAVTLAPGNHDPQGDPTNTIPKGMDDLLLAPDGNLYIAGHLSGELLRVDPATGDACVVASGLQEPSSVRLARGFGDFGGKVFVSTFGGTGVSGLFLGQAGAPPPGKVLVFDFGFADPGPAPTATPLPGATSSAPERPEPEPNPFGNGTGSKDSPAAPVALLGLALLGLALRRR